MEVVDPGGSINQPSPADLPRVLGALALSNHYVEVTFTEPVGAAGENVGNFLIIDQDGNRLGVTSAQVVGDGDTVRLTTESQQTIEYELGVGDLQAAKSIDEIRAASGGNTTFTGSTQNEPALLTAISLSNTSVLLTFSERMEQTTAENAGFYQIAAGGNGEPLDVLDVSAALLEASETTVVLTTSPQQGLQYEVTATNIEAASGGHLIDPTRNSAAFIGIPPVDNDPPELLGAVSTSSTTVLLSFGEPLADNAADPINFEITPTLVVTGAVLSLHNAQIVLTTLPQVAGVEYTVQVFNVTDRATPDGNVIDDSDPSASSKKFTFSGEPAVTAGNTLPRVVGAASTSNSSVIVTFSKPMGDSAENPGHYIIVQENVNPEAASLGVTDAAFLGDDSTVVELTTLSQNEVTYFLTAVNVKDLAGNQLAPPEILVDPSTASFAGTPPGCALFCTNGSTGIDGAGKCISDDDCTGNPTCAPRDGFCSFGGNVGRTGCVSAADKGLYCDLSDDDADGDGVPDADIVCVVPSCVDSCEQQCNLGDTDEDGIPNNVEQNGWVVAINLVDGRITLRDVTADPFSADTDGDGLDDGEEREIGSNPRARDTDGDLLDDEAEWNDWYSDPTDQDSDGDGLDDGLEVLTFRTSPVIADTDGDQISDDVEILERNRNPLLADLPRPQVNVDEVRLDLQIISSYTEEDGTVRTVEDSASSTFTQSRSTQIGNSSTTSTESENEFSQKLGYEHEFGPGAGGWQGTISGEVGFGQKRANGFSSTVSRESAESSQNEYQRSVSNALEESERRSVTRTVDEAIVQASVNIANLSDIAFTITNLEVSVLQQDRRNSLRFRPIATLRPTGATDPTNQPSFNLGPFDPERGPIIFENVNVFPNLIDDLMREPTGLIFEVVNFDILDEFGRNFVFSSQEVNDRTVGITIDFGDGTVETYRVAANSTFDPQGRPIGISMQRALEIAEITKRSGNDTTVPDPLTEPFRTTYGTFPVTRNAVTFEGLTRVRGAQNDLSTINTPNADPEKRFWVVIGSNLGLIETADFSTIQVLPGDDFLFLFTRDIDEDGLFEKEEYLYGSSDRDTDSDGDTLGDFFEVRTGWTVFKIPGAPYKTFSSPARDDSDLDTLRDDVELAFGTDPNRADTDEDALGDAVEIEDEIEIVLFDGDSDDSNNEIITITPYSDWAIIDGGNLICNTTKAGDDVQVVASGAAVASGGICIGPGPNGVMDTTPAGDDIASLAPALVNGTNDQCDTTKTGDDIQIITSGSAATDNQVVILAGVNGVIDSTPGGDDYIRAVHNGLFTIDPLRQDTDLDGIPDGREILTGTNPNRKDAGSVIDSDGDGLFDDEEDAGWDVIVVDASGVSTTTHVTSSKFRADSDLDGVPDVLERAIGSNPRLRDTDEDDLSDLIEFDPDDTDNYYDDAALEEANRRCDLADSCFYDNPNPNLQDRLRTDVAKADTDADGLDDDFENRTDWTITVFGQSPRTVRSLPYRADGDGDGLNDCQEFLGLGSTGSCTASPTQSATATDPTDADTDDDTIANVLDGNDGYERSVARNPLRVDQKITFDYTSIIVNDDCGDAGSSAEWFGELDLTWPTGSDTVFDCDNCCFPEDSGTCNTNTAAETFILFSGQSFTASSNTWTENDSSSADETVGSFSESFSYPVGATSSTFAFDGPDCLGSIEIGYSITVQ
jgi:hypothetical protein